MGMAKVQGFLFEYLNAEEFRVLKREIFSEHRYYIELGTRRPRIIDAGAHIGLATGYFRWLYPEALITAIEPNPQLVKLLQNNLELNQWWTVMVEEVALAGNRGSVPFYFDKSPDKWYSTGGLTRGAWNGRQESGEIQVAAVPLTDYLSEPVDLLKLDIEGAEEEVLQATGDRIQNVKHIIMEYHKQEGNSLDEIERFLEIHDFRVEVKKGRPRDEGLVMVEAWQTR